MQVIYQYQLLKPIVSVMHTQTYYKKILKRQQTPLRFLKDMVFFYVQIQNTTTLTSIHIIVYTMDNLVVK